jgi:uncharacterized protein (TIGR02996 family)
MAAATADELAFLRAVLAAPDDDTVRLVYADWLEEHGGEVECGGCRGEGWYWSDDARSYRSDCHPCSGTGRVPNSNAERAEFIRVQCELERLRGRRDSLGRRIGHVHAVKIRELDRRAGELWDAATRLAIDTTVFWPVTVRRGFVEEVACDGASWLARGDELVWSPGQTVECPSPSCSKLYPGRLRTDWHWECDVCAGTGRVPRPCPPTAQPVVRVRLTTWPEWETRSDRSLALRLHGRDRWHDIPLGADQVSRGSIVAKLLAAEWPGVEFTPPDRPA